MQIESQEGMIELPVEQLVNPAGTDTNMNGWSQKMKDTFHAMGGRAREASKLAYSKASESYTRVASAVRTPSTGASVGAMSTPEMPAPSPVTDTVTADASADAGYVDPEDDDDDEEGMIVHAGFGAPQKPLANSAVGGPVFLGLDGDSDGTKEDDEDEGEKEAPVAPAESDEASAQQPKPESS